MPQSEKRIGLKKFKPAISRIQQLHPHKMLNYLLITGSTLLYLFIFISFLQKSEFDFKLVTQIHFPKIIHISTIILVGSLIFSSRILDFYHNDRIVELRRYLSLIIISALSFIITQSFVWIELLSMELSGTIQNYHSYLYIISGIHMVQVVGAIIFLSFLLYRVSTVEGDQVKSIILLTNPYEKIKLEIITTCWNYIVISWMVIYLFCLVVY